MDSVKKNISNNVFENVKIELEYRMVNDGGTVGNPKKHYCRSVRDSVWESLVKSIFSNSGIVAAATHDELRIQFNG